jgi:isopenicillin N synthase-like dioxygenase
MSDNSIPVIDISPLFGAPSAARETTDRAIMMAAQQPGFFIAQGLTGIPIDAAARQVLLRIFQLPARELQKLWRRKFAPANANVYRGWFPLQPGNLTSKEGIDLGPDIVYGPAVLRAGDPLCEATPLPPEAVLPGWREAMAQYYLALERTSAALMRGIARSLRLPGGYFDEFFDQGISTLRLIRYPVRADLEWTAGQQAGLWVSHGAGRSYIMGAPHVDSGFLTLLLQDGVPGLQARHRNGLWMDVPPMENTLAVNFGKVLERWCNGRIKATEHRVVGTGRERMSIPFFYEARVDAKIQPLPDDDPAAFEPFLYGDYLWAATTRFVEFQGLEGMRTPSPPQLVGEPVNSLRNR